MSDWTEQWDDCAACEFCGSLVKQETLDASGWQPIATMPEQLWAYVFVPGAGMGFEAIMRDGVITGLISGKTIRQATYWRKVWTPPTGDLSGNYDYLALIDGVVEQVSALSACAPRCQIPPEGWACAKASGHFGGCDVISAGWDNPLLGLAYGEVERLRNRLMQPQESGIDEVLRRALDAIEEADDEIRKVSA